MTLEAFTELDLRGTTFQAPFNLQDKGLTLLEPEVESTLQRLVNSGLLGFHELVYLTDGKFILEVQKDSRFWHDHPNRLRQVA